MPTKKQIIIIGVLSTISLGLGYWYGMPEESSGGGGGKENAGNGGGKEETTPEEPEFLKQGLVAYYPFNGNAKDESGNGYHGALNDGASLTIDRKGAASRAVSFDGVDDMLTTLYPGNIEHNFSFSFWAHPRDVTRVVDEHNSGSIAGLPGHKGLIQYPSGGSTGEAGIGVNLGINGINVVEHADHHLPAVLVYAANLAGWKHYTVVVVNSRPYLYINGALVRQGLQSNKTILWSDFHGGEIHPGEAIGRAGYGAYAGQMDELRIYNRALSEADVKELYEFEKPKTQQASTAKPPAVVTPTSVNPKPTPEQKQKALRDSVVGEYERKDDGDNHKQVFLDNGVRKVYKNGKKTADYKWYISNGEIHIKYTSGLGTRGNRGTYIWRINTDKSITWIASIYGGKRRDRPKESQSTYKKIK